MTNRLNEAQRAALMAPQPGEHDEGSGAEGPEDDVVSSVSAHQVVRALKITAVFDQLDPQLLALGAKAMRDIARQAANHPKQDTAGKLVAQVLRTIANACEEASRG